MTPPEVLVYRSIYKGKVIIKMRIFILDDDEMLRGLVKEALQDRGHDVDEAGSYGAGVRLFQAGAYDAVVTDNSFPDGSGPQFIRHVQSIDPDVFVVMMTGDNIRSLRREFHHIRHVPALHKPFRVQRLFRLLEGSVAYRRRFESRRPGGSRREPLLLASKF